MARWPADRRTLALCASGLLLALGGCAEDRSRTDEENRTVWRARDEVLEKIGLDAAIVQTGSRVDVTVTNKGDQVLCISPNLWPSDAVGLDHFWVEEDGSIIDYSGALYAIFEGAPPLRLEPGTSWTLQLDLLPYYRADWRTARVKDFWAPFSPCVGPNIA